MRKVAIVFAAAAGISAISGTAYVYTTDTCLTDSCRAEKVRERDALIEREWRLIAEAIDKKASLTSLMKDDLNPLINNHFQSVHKRIERSLIVNSRCTPDGWTNMSTVEGYDLCSEYDPTEQNQNERNRIAIIDKIDKLKSSGDNLRMRLSILGPEIDFDEKTKFNLQNSDFDEQFSATMAGLNEILDDNVIQENNRIFVELQSRISESMIRINSLEYSGRQNQATINGR